MEQVRERGRQIEESRRQEAAEAANNALEEAKKVAVDARKALNEAKQIAEKAEQRTSEEQGLLWEKEKNAHECGVRLLWIWLGCLLAAKITNVFDGYVVSAVFLVVGSFIVFGITDTEDNRVSFIFHRLSQGAMLAAVPMSLFYDCGKTNAWLLCILAIVSVIIFLGKKWKTSVLEERVKLLEAEKQKAADMLTQRKEEDQKATDMLKQRKEEAKNLAEAVWGREGAARWKTMKRLGLGANAGETKTLELSDEVSIEMVWCPPGTFLMGSPKDEEGRDGDETQHQVTLTKGFWMAKTPVTQKQWKSVMGYNPSEDMCESGVAASRNQRVEPWDGERRLVIEVDGLFTVELDCSSTLDSWNCPKPSRNAFEDEGNSPVGNVSWDDCQKFCKKAGLRLPTEAEWEYACRAGTTGPYAGTGILDEMGWYTDNSGSRNRVGQKKPNAWGVCDMHGNMEEWCADWYGAYPDGDVTNPTGAVSGSRRVLRGGCRVAKAENCRSASRTSDIPGEKASFYGFRPIARPE